ncbi:helix-turn-helix domain-containing protein [Kovacikia minuta CCNUW1]|uniref:helix-turn-helix domain-containing protein n=1 Tax=Kovacikia minuta TaxID=2931930 RepID=UPI001CCCB697|nr:helix-turn-helix transcriptional regulator [Kovacikia minuta]UBF25703.1 helix-turn-helix domain-containing protein [Kovacikia minuta CCNUW1]
MNINLRGARERAGLSQVELATILGLSQAQVSRYEQDPGAIPTELLLRWAQALGTDIQTLMVSAIPLPPPVECWRSVSTITARFEFA